MERELEPVLQDILQAIERVEIARSLVVYPLSIHSHQMMNANLAKKVGRRAAKRLSAYAESVRAKSPLPVVQILLFGSRARGEAASESDWDVAVVVQSNNDGDIRKIKRDVLDVCSDLALPHIVAGFHLRPILICATEGNLDPLAWQVSPNLAHNISVDGLVIH